MVGLEGKGGRHSQCRDENGQDPLFTVAQQKGAVQQEGLSRGQLRIAVSVQRAVKGVTYQSGYSGRDGDHAKPSNICLISATLCS